MSDHEPDIERLGRLFQTLLIRVIREKDQGDDDADRGLLPGVDRGTSD